MAFYMFFLLTTIMFVYFSVVFRRKTHGCPRFSHSKTTSGDHRMAQLVAPLAGAGGGGDAPPGGDGDWI